MNKIFWSKIDFINNRAHIEDNANSLKINSEKFEPYIIEKVMNYIEINN